MKIFIKDEKGIIRINKDQIVSVVHLNRKCKIYLEGASTPVAINKPLCSILSIYGDSLIQIGRNQLVNLEKIVRINKDFSIVQLTTGTELKISRRGAKLLRDTINRNSL